MLYYNKRTITYCFTSDFGTYLLRSGNNIFFLENQYIYDVRSQFVHAEVLDWRWTNYVCVLSKFNSMAVEYDFNQYALPIKSYE